VLKAFKTLAENIAESLVKDDRIFVHGTINTDTRGDNDTADKTAAQRVLAEVVGPSLRWATTRITKTTRTQSRTRWLATYPTRRPDHGRGARRSSATLQAHIPTTASVGRDTPRRMPAQGWSRGEAAAPQSRLVRPNPRHLVRRGANRGAK
jgi:single-stranded DNA-binding protein